MLGWMWWDVAPVVVVTGTQEHASKEQSRDNEHSRGDAHCQGNGITEWIASGNHLFLVFLIELVHDTALGVW